MSLSGKGWTPLQGWLYPRWELEFVKKLGEGQFGEVLLMIACVSETCRECTREHECAFVHMCRLCAYNMNIVSLSIHELVANCSRSCELHSSDRIGRQGNKDQRPRSNSVAGPFSLVTLYILSELWSSQLPEHEYCPLPPSLLCTLTYCTHKWCSQKFAVPPMYQWL